MALKRDLIMQAAMTRFAGILTTAGYYSNLGSNAFEWRPKVMLEGGGGYVPTEQSELPALHVRDVDDLVIVADLSGNEDHELTLELEIAHEAAATGQTMRKEIQDVRKAIAVDRTWGGLARADYKDQSMSANTIRLQADRTFYRTLIQTKIMFSTSAFGEE
jgi:hypothetical protein